MLVVVMIFGLFASIGVMNIDSVKAQSQPQSVLLLSDDRFFADVDMDIPAIQAFLERQPGILKSYDAQVGDETQSAAIIIMGNVEYHNISPRVLLALLELKSEILSTIQPTDMQSRYPMGHIDPNLAGLPLQVDWAARELAQGFNEDYLKPLQFIDGQSITLSGDVNRASYAIYRFLSFDTTYAEWQALTAVESSSGFVGRYQQIWGISSTYIDPGVSNTAPIISGYNPFLILPFHGAHSITSYFDHEYPTYTQNGSTVIYTGQRGGYSYDGHDAVDYGLNYETVYASAAGTVTFAGGSTNYCWVTDQNETALVVTIQHSNGHKTSYWHLNRIDVSVGQSVSQDQQIAQSGNTGCSTGAHLHFSVRRDVGGTYRLTDPYGWEGGYTEPCTQNSTCASSDYLFFIPDTTPPTTSISLSGTAGDNGWYKSTVQVTLSAADNSGGSGISQTQYKIDAGSWQTYSAPFSVSMNGVHIVYYKSLDVAGNWETEKTALIKIDSISPTGSLAIQTGIAGENGWYLSAVNISLSAIDNSGGSGVSQTQYKIDTGSWQTYSTPFSVSTDGVHTVYYKSLDVAGNWETEKSTPVKIDSISPTGSLAIQNGSTQTYSTVVNLNTQANDATSGVAAVRFRDSAQATWSIWYAPGSTFWQLIGSHGQTASVEAQFKDNAGNVSAVYLDNITINLYPVRPFSSLYVLQSSTFGAVGMQVNSSQYVLNGTAGQPTIIGQMESSNYRMNSGYWAMIEAPSETTTYYLCLPLILR